MGWWEWECGCGLWLWWWWWWWCKEVPSRGWCGLLWWLSGLSRELVTKLSTLNGVMWGPWSIMGPMMQWEEGDVEWGEPLISGDAIPMDAGDMLEVDEQPLPPPPPTPWSDDWFLWDSKRSMNTLVVEENFPDGPVCCWWQSSIFMSIGSDFIEGWPFMMIPLLVEFPPLPTVLLFNLPCWWSGKKIK